MAAAVRARFDGQPPQAVLQNPFRLCPVRSRTDPAVYFEGNLFSGNRLVNGTPGRFSVMPIYDYIFYFIQNQFYQEGPIPGTRIVQPSDFKISNNTFTQNNFGQGPPLFIFLSSPPFTPGVIIDGGGNRCSPPASGPYPLVCN